MIPKNNKLLKNAKTLRKEMTAQERHLWYDFLRGYPIRFYRQRIIGDYIVDFYCAKAKLVIEIDGSQHFEEKGLFEDKRRDDFLKSLGLQILRFSNIDVDRCFEGVCMAIDDKVKCAL